MKKIMAMMFMLMLVMSNPGFTQVSRVWGVDDGERIKKTVLNHPLRTSSNNNVWNEATQTISVFGGRNEFVAFQLILQAGASTATNVNVTFDGLTKSTSPSFTIDNSGWNGDPYNYVNRHIEMFVMHYMNINVRTDESFTGWSSARAGATGDPVWSDNDFLGWHGEQLVPFEAPAGSKANGQGGAPFTVTANQNQSVWIDIYIPKTAPAGNYAGVLKVTEGGTTRYTIPINLQVYNFTLSDVTHLVSVGLFEQDELRDRHRLSGIETAAYHDIVKKYMQFGKRHRLNLQRPAQKQNLHWQFLKEAYTGTLFTSSRGYYGPGEGQGPEKFYIGVWDQPRRTVAGNNLDRGYKTGFGDVERTILPGNSPDTTLWKSLWWSASNTWADSFAVYAPNTSVEKYGVEEASVNGGCDETGVTSGFYDIARKARWMATNPGSGSSIKYVVSDNFRPEQKAHALITGGTFDLSTGQAGYICNVAGGNPYPRGLMVDSVASWRAAGIPLSWYSGTRPSTGNDMIDSPPADWRMRPWMMWKLDIGGYRIWQVNKGGSTYNAWAKDYRDTGGKTWGDGTLIYAGQEKSAFSGDDRGLAGPIAGVRLKNWRRGVQDHEYLWLAKQMGINTTTIVKSIVNKVGSQLAQNQPVPLDGWAQHGYQYEAARRQLAELIGGGTTPIPTGDVSLISPITGSNGMQTTQQLVWGKTSGTTTYHIQVSMDSTFSTTIVDDSLGTDTTKTINGLINLTRYNWRVRAKNVSGYGQFSAPWSFTTISVGKTGLYFSHIAGTGNDATVILPGTIEPSVGGEPLQIGDEIGAFTPAGVCIGGGEWNGANLTLVIWGDNTQTSEIDGILPGEAIHYRVWQWSTGLEYSGVSVSYESGNGVYSANSSHVLSSFLAIIQGVGQVEIPTEFSLKQNYPNPFNPSTRISFALPIGGTVSLKIFNSIGEEIATLVDGFVPAGLHNKEFDAANLASGVYFYRLAASSFTATGKMMLMK